LRFEIDKAGAPEGAPDTSVRAAVVKAANVTVE
jgi:hypothetical protein